MKVFYLLFNYFKDERIGSASKWLDKVGNTLQVRSYLLSAFLVTLFSFGANAQGVIDCSPEAFSLACNDNLNVTLNENCVAPLTPDAVLEGITKDCEPSYYVKVAYPYEGYSINEVTKCGTFKYTVYYGDAENPDTENDIFICWGYITGEDKTPPYGGIDKVIGLRKVPGTAEPVVQHDEVVDVTIKADLFGMKDGNPGFKRINGQYWYYDPVTCEDVWPNDGVSVLYDRTNSDINLLVCSDVDSIYNVPASWRNSAYAYWTGTPYLSDNCASPGWEPVITKVTDVLHDYACTYEYLPCVQGRAVSQYITRTFYFEDEKGNKGSAEQIICFFKPKMKLPDCKAHFDICWYSADSELKPKDIGSYPSFVNGACMEMPILDHVCNVTVTYEDLRLPGPAKCGDKIIRTWTILDWCWDPISFADLDYFSLEENYNNGCPFYPDFDSWNNKKITWEQHLIIGDQQKPIVDCPKPDPEWYNGSDAPTFSTGPFGCEGGFEVPEPTVKKFNPTSGKNEAACQYTWTVEVWVEVDELWHGVPTGKKIKQLYPTAQVIADIDKEAWVTNGVSVSNVPKGAHYFRYIVEDHCGNVGYSDYCRFYIIDEVAPVAICDDDLNVSIGGDNYSRVYAADIDEGSYDNCSDVELSTRRFIPEDCLDAFVANTEWSFNAIYLATKGRDINGDIITDPITLDKPASVYDGVKGYYTPWFDYVDFVCCDIKGEVLIELKVTDNANMSRDKKRDPLYGDCAYTFYGYPNGYDYDYDDYYGPYQCDNYNVCWLEVYVEDKLPPICNAPKDKEVDCQDVPYDLPEVSPHTTESKRGVTWDAEELEDPANADIVEWLNSFNEDGRPDALDNCNAVAEMTRVRFFIHCKSGYIERTFQATDDWGLTSNNSCKQVIWINRHHDYCIKFPKDAEAECKEEPDVPTVEFFEYGCDLLAVSIQDERFNADIDKGDDSECYKIFRTYRVINWCQFDEDIDPDLPLFDRFDSYYDIDPLVVGRDEDCDGWPGDEDVYVRFKGKEGKDGLLIEDEDEFGTWIDSDCEPWNDSPKANKGCENPWGHWEYHQYYTGGFYQYTQVIKVFDNVAPEVASVGEDRFPTYASPGKGENKADVCVGTVNRMFEVDDECTPDHVKVVSVTLKPDPALGLGPVVLFEKGATTTLGASFGFAKEKDELKYTLSGVFPIGEHSFAVKVEDGCGIANGIDLDFEVFDDKAPAPICNSSLSMVLMPVDMDNDGRPDEGEGMAAVWAKDFIASEIWDCSEPIKYTIERAADIDAGAEPDPEQTNLVLDCDDDEVVLVYIYAWDAVGNRDRCEAMVLLADNFGVCDPTTVGSLTSIAGAIFTEENSTVEGVNVNLTGGQAATTNSATNGEFVFGGLEIGADYTVSPFLDEDHSNGVSTFDMIVVSKHILGIEGLNSPYKMIAADVNNSMSITTLDLIMMRKVILRIDDKFTNNTSWRFVDVNYNFPEPTNPWKEQFSEVYNINDIEAPELRANFVAVKIGDVNGSAIANSEGLVFGRNNGQVFNLDLDEQALTQNGTYEIPVRASDLNQVQGFQMTLAWDTQLLEYVDVQPGLMEAANFGTQFADKEGMLTLSYFNLDDVADQSVLFTLVVRANQAANLSEALRVSTRYTSSEAYPKGNNLGNELMEVALNFSNGKASLAAYELYQNTPNPFVETTQVGFYLPEASAVKLTIRDIRGSLLKVYEGDYQKGTHNITVKASDIGNPTGVVLYTLESDNFTQTKQMTLVK